MPSLHGKYQEPEIIANVKLCGYEHSSDTTSYKINHTIYINIVNSFIPSHAKSSTCSMENIKPRLGLG